MTQKRLGAETDVLKGKRESRRSEAKGESWRKTEHFSDRQRQRRITDLEVRLALRFGARFHEGDDCVHFLGRNHLPVTTDRQAARIRESADGVVVVRRRDGSLTTTYRNPKYIAKLKRRQRRRRCRRGRCGLRSFEPPQINV